MTQATFLPAVYLLDSCCPIHLEGLNRVLPGQPPGPLAFTPLERGLIWQGLERLTGEGRLQLIKQVVEELRDPAFLPVLNRLQSFRGYRVFRMSNDLRLRYRQLMTKYPELARAIARYDPQRDPADPWLIVYAQKYGYAIATEEVPSSQRRAKARRGPPIPDVCDSEGIHCVNLRRLANDEGWTT